MRALHRRLFPSTLIVIVVITALTSCAKKAPVTPTAPPPVAAAPLPTAPPVAPEFEAFAATTCDVGLWKHVYHGKKPTARDRLVVITVVEGAGGGRGVR